MKDIVFDGTFAGWQSAARETLQNEQPPDDVQWLDAREGQASLLLAEEEAGLPSPHARAGAAPVHRVPRAFVELARTISCHREPRRWDLLYRMLWRLTHGEPHLLAVAMDADTHEANRLAKAVGHDLHKMRAFVRFREVTTAEGPWFVAWFEPQHHIVEANAPFFVERFTSMRWSILTPDRCAHWDRVNLTFTAGVTRAEAPPDDAMEDLWRTYYASIFNPARIKLDAMQSQMAKHYWKNLPEAEIISTLVAAGPQRVETMIAASDSKRDGDLVPATRAPVPVTDDPAVLAEAAATCRACPLWQNATCTVFGEGPPRARVVIVGEQPGDQEDRAGKPFIGPAGLLFNRALAAAGVERSELYVTNAVKHFKWEPRGKRRLHQKPNAREVAACRPWLEAELRAVRPELIVCLGATAAQSVLGTSIRVTEERGRRFETEFGAPALIMVHPSSLLRLPADRDPEAEFARFVEDLRRILDGR